MTGGRDNLTPSDDAPMTAPKPDVNPVPPPPLKTDGSRAAEASPTDEHDKPVSGQPAKPQFGEPGTDAEEPPEPLKNGFA